MDKCIKNERLCYIDFARTFFCTIVVLQFFSFHNICEKFIAIILISIFLVFQVSAAFYCLSQWVIVSTCSISTMKYIWYIITRWVFIFQEDMAIEILMIHLLHQQLSSSEINLTWKKLEFITWYILAAFINTNRFVLLRWLSVCMLFMCIVCRNPTPSELIELFPYVHHTSSNCGFITTRCIFCGWQITNKGFITITASPWWFPSLQHGFLPATHVSKKTKSYWHNPWKVASCLCAAQNDPPTYVIVYQYM